MLGRITHDMARQIGDAGQALAETLSETFLEPTLRLGVTGLARAGKTVFITSLVANLLNPGRMAQLAGASRITAAWLQPQPDMTVARFPFEDHLAALTGPEPRWPEPTHALSELRLSLRLAPQGMLAGLRGRRSLHLDIVDYPGEWLLDLTLMGRDHDDWARATLQKAEERPGGPEYLAAAAALDPAAPFDELQARAIAAAWVAYLRRCRAAGYCDLSPGRFLMPGEMEGSPALTFAPLPAPAAGSRPPGRRSLWQEMRRRYDAYRRQVAIPFFRDHLSRIDRQVVLIDLLSAVAAGPQPFEDLRQASGAILSAFRPGRNGLLRELVMGRRVERILFAATKADHLHHSQHARMAALTSRLVEDARRRADYRGARTEAMAIASVRATIEEEREVEGRPLPMVRGTLPGGRQQAFFPGELPEDTARLFSSARQGVWEWPDGPFDQIAFRPATDGLRAGEGPPHIRLDRAAQFLFGDLL